MIFLQNHDFILSTVLFDGVLLIDQGAYSKIFDLRRLLDVKMSKNALYNLIGTKLDLGSDDIPATRVSKLTHSKGKKYYLFELPVDEQVGVGDYTLTSHHISVYESSTAKLDLKSQYHYTAFFEDKSGEQFRLHVFFDSRDNMVSQPLLTRVTDDDFIPVDCSEFEEDLKIFADLSKADLVKFLREKQKQELDLLQNEYDKQEKKSADLSRNMLKNKSQFLEFLDRQVALLKRMQSYSNNPASISSTQRFLQNVKKNVESTNFETESVSAKKSVASSTSDAGTSRKSKKHKHPAVSKPVLDRPVVIKPSLAQLVADLNSRLEGYKLLDTAQSIPLIVRLYEELREKEWEVDFGTYAAKLEDLRDLKQFRVNIEKAGTSLLQTTLLKDILDEAEKLRVFYPLLPDSIASYALMNNKFRLLDFVLRNNIVSTDYTDFSVKSVRYSSMFAYCMNTCGLNAASLNIFEILVKNGASLMDVDPSTGLPYIVAILADREHPFYSVLVKNEVLDVKFYQHLNQVLRVLAAKADCPGQRKSQIADLIAQYKLQIDVLKQQVLSGVSLAIKSTANESEPSIGEEMLARLSVDPEILFRQKIIQKKLREVSPKIPYKQRLAMSSMCTINYEKLKIALDSVDDLDDLPTYEELKSQLIERQLLSIESIELINELLELQNVTKGLMGMHKKPNKTHRGYFKRSQEILERFDAIGHILEQPIEASWPRNNRVDAALAFLNFLSDSLKAFDAEPNQVDAEPNQVDSEPERVDSGAEQVDSETDQDVPQDDEPDAAEIKDEDALPGFAQMFLSEVYGFFGGRGRDDSRAPTSSSTFEKNTQKDEAASKKFQ